MLAVASQTWLSAEGDNPWLANSGAVLLRRPISSTCSCDASGSRQVRHSNGADTLLSQGRRPESHGGKSLPPAFHTDEADNVYSAFYSGRVLNSMFDSDCGAPAAALPAVRCRCCPSCWCALCGARATSQGWGRASACCWRLRSFSVAAGVGTAGLRGFMSSPREQPKSPAIYRPPRQIFIDPSTPFHLRAACTHLNSKLLEVVHPLGV